MYAVGLTHHTSGVQIIRGIGLLQMLLGNVGIPGGGVNAERGHANIQGNTDNAISWEILPGYLGIRARHGDDGRVPRPDPGQAAAPQLGQLLRQQLREVPGQPAQGVLRPGRDGRQRLRLLVDPEAGEELVLAHDPRRGPGRTARRHHLRRVHRRHRRPGLQADGRVAGQPQVAGDHGSAAHLGVGVLARAGRRSRGHPDRSAVPPGHPLDREVGVVHQLGPMGAVEAQGAAGDRRVPGRQPDPRRAVPPGAGAVRGRGRGVPRPGAQHPLALRRPRQPRPRGAGPRGERRRPPDRPAAVDVRQPDRRRQHLVGELDLLRILDRGRQPDGPAGVEDPTGLGYFHNWAWSWPLNRRILYNRASADANGEPWDPTRPGISWDGSKWVGDVPDFPATSAPRPARGRSS